MKDINTAPHAAFVLPQGDGPDTYNTHFGTSSPSKWMQGGYGNESYAFNFEEIEAFHVNWEGDLGDGTLHLCLKSGNWLSFSIIDKWYEKFLHDLACFQEDRVQVKGWLRTLLKLF